MTVPNRDLQIIATTLSQVANMGTDKNYYVQVNPEIAAAIHRRLITYDWLIMLLVKLRDKEMLTPAEEEALYNLTVETTHSPSSKQSTPKFKVIEGGKK